VTESPGLVEIKLGLQDARPSSLQHFVWKDEARLLMLDRLALPTAISLIVPAEAGATLSAD
jgi:hypothetical protein